MTLVASSGSKLRGWNPLAQGALFFDHFEGSAVDTGKWVVLDRRADTVNGEVNHMGPDAVTVGSSLLNITSSYVPAGFLSGDSEMDPETVYYLSGQIMWPTLTFQYGTVECRSKCPGGTGLWPLLWLLGFEWQASQPFTANTPGHAWPNAGWGEIDAMEFLSNSRTVNNCAVWFANANTGNGSAEGGNLPVNATSQFLIWRLVWQADLLEWSVSDDEGETFTTLRTITDTAQIPNVPMYVILSTAVGGIGGGTPNPATFPQTYQVDWLRVTQ